MINKLKIKNYKLKANSGFTVLESIIAIMVLSLSISGAFAAVRQGLHQSVVSKEEIRAFYLAQEVVEIVRNKRDTNQIAFLNDNNTDWLLGITSDISDNCYFGKVCDIDASSYNFTSLGSIFCGYGWNTCNNLRQSTVHYRYGHDLSWPMTNFKREIMFESVSADEVAMIVRITWTKGLFIKEFKIKTHFFRWV